ncbi:MAG: hypothetical protein V9E94_09825 [Microthrixaceae bacterium]
MAAEYEATQVRDEREQAAHDKGLQYVGLDGSVGIIANGAGLAMTHARRRQPGRRQRRRTSSTSAAAPTPTSWRARSRSSTTTRPCKSIFINIFGGITRGEEVANGIIEALGRVDDRRPDRHPPRWHQRRRGPGDPPSRTCPTSCRCSPRCSTQRARSCSSPTPAEGEPTMSIFVDREHQGRLPGPDR